MFLDHLEVSHNPVVPIAFQFVTQILLYHLFDVLRAQHWVAHNVFLLFL